LVELSGSKVIGGAVIGTIGIPKNGACLVKIFVVGMVGRRPPAGFSFSDTSGCIVKGIVVIENTICGNPSNRISQI
jgi:hypothetical protein